MAAVIPAPLPPFSNVVLSLSNRNMGYHTALSKEQQALAAITARNSFTPKEISDFLSRTSALQNASVAKQGLRDRAYAFACVHELGFAAGGPNNVARAYYDQENEVDDRVDYQGVVIEKGLATQVKELRTQVINKLATACLDSIQKHLSGIHSLGTSPAQTIDSLDQLKECALKCAALFPGKNKTRTKLLKVHTALKTNLHPALQGYTDKTIEEYEQLLEKTLAKAETLNKRVPKYEALKRQIEERNKPASEQDPVEERTVWKERASALANRIGLFRERSINPQEELEKLGADIAELCRLQALIITHAGGVLTGQETSPPTCSQKFRILTCRNVNLNTRSQIVERLKNSKKQISRLEKLKLELKIENRLVQLSYIHVSDALSEVKKVLATFRKALEDYEALKISLDEDPDQLKDALAAVKELKEKLTEAVDNLSLSFGNLQASSRRMKSDSFSKALAKLFDDITVTLGEFDAHKTRFSHLVEKEKTKKPDCIDRAIDRMSELVGHLKPTPVTLVDVAGDVARTGYDLTKLPLQVGYNHWNKLLFLAALTAVAAAALNNQQDLGIREAVTGVAEQGKDLLQGAAATLLGAAVALPGLATAVCDFALRMFTPAAGAAASLVWALPNATMQFYKGDKLRGVCSLALGIGGAWLPFADSGKVKTAAAAIQAAVTSSEAAIQMAVTLAPPVGLAVAAGAAKMAANAASNHPNVATGLNTLALGATLGAVATGAGAAGIDVAKGALQVATTALSNTVAGPAAIAVASGLGAGVASRYGHDDIANALMSGAAAAALVGTANVAGVPAALTSLVGAEDTVTAYRAAAAGALAGAAVTAHRKGYNKTAAVAQTAAMAAGGPAVLSRPVLTAAVGTVAAAILSPTAAKETFVSAVTSASTLKGSLLTGVAVSALACAALPLAGAALAGATIATSFGLGGYLGRRAQQA